jgi:hypothetical protein
VVTQPIPPEVLKPLNPELVLDLVKEPAKPLAETPSSPTDTDSPATDLPETGVQSLPQWQDQPYLQETHLRPLPQGVSLLASQAVMALQNLGLRVSQGASQAVLLVKAGMVRSQAANQALSRLVSQANGLLKPLLAKLLQKGRLGGDK